jgi:N-ethylmaleimide reductase
VPDLFDPTTVGKLDLPHRIVMAPLTRNRAGAGGVPGDLAVEYYRQRASAALIVTEGTQPSAVGQGYLDTPGVHSDEQVAGWSRVADAVHDEGGRIVVQLMHAGRIAHPENKGGLETVAPSAIAAPGEIITATGSHAYPTPRALETDEIPGIVADYVNASQQAVAAGLDGVELHAANGYLLHQFLSPTSNVPSSRRSGRRRSASASRPRTTSRAPTSRTPPTSPRPTATWSTSSPRSAWPTCRCWPTREASSCRTCDLASVARWWPTTASAR